MPSPPTPRPGSCQPSGCGAPARERKDRVQLGACHRSTESFSRAEKGAIIPVRDPKKPVGRRGEARGAPHGGAGGGSRLLPSRCRLRRADFWREHNPPARRRGKGDGDRSRVRARGGTAAGTAPLRAGERRGEAGRRWGTAGARGGGGAGRAAAPPLRGRCPGGPRWPGRRSWHCPTAGERRGTAARPEGGAAGGARWSDRRRPRRRSREEEGGEGGKQGAGWEARNKSPAAGAAGLGLRRALLSPLPSRGWGGCGAPWAS